ncbi:hypothetical protein WJX82_001791 [Trebouxia sp. C0006]
MKLTERCICCFQVLSQIHPSTAGATLPIFFGKTFTRQKHFLATRADTTPGLLRQGCGSQPQQSVVLPNP